MNEWVTSWIISAVIYGFFVRSLRRASLPLTLALSAATPVFFAPLGLLLHSGNSVFYVFDIAVPVLFWWAVRSGPNPTLPPLAYLLIAAGIWPLLGAFIYKPSWTDFAIVATNCYRLVGACCLALALTRRASSLSFSSIAVLFSIVGIVLLAVMVAQASGAIRTNAYELLWRSATYAEGYVYADKRFVVLGMFKAEQGRIFDLILCFSTVLMCSNRSREYTFGLVATTLLFVALILTGSKTSILCGAVTLIGSAALFPSARLFVPLGAVAMLFIGFIRFVRNSFAARFLVNSTLYSFLSTNGGDTTTLDLRADRFGEVLSYISENPLILFGVHTHAGPQDMNTGYFHNEYLSVLTLGGVPSLILYAIGITIIWLTMWRARTRSAFARTGLLLLIANLVQGLTVAHVEPGFLFVSSTALSFFVYALGMHSFGPEVAKTPQRTNSAQGPRDALSGPIRI